MAEPETDVPVLMMVDATLTIDDSGFLPIAMVLENIKQALAPISGVELHMAHVSIKEHRDLILHAFDDANDEEQRRLVAETPASKGPTDG